MSVRDLANRVLTATPGSPAFARASQELARLAFCGDADIAAAASRTVFAEIVEWWSDQFEPNLCDAYSAFMCEVLYATGSPVADALAESGYPTPADLARRYHRIRTGLQRAPLSRAQVKRVVVLSRVTLGADVAVTSTVIRAALSAFPNARVDLVAPEKNIALIGADTRVHGHPVRYVRDALLGDRLRSWLAVRTAVTESITHLDAAEWILVDPDSRLSQLGMLPIVDDRYCHFFESRSGLGGSTKSLGRLAAQWCGATWQIDADQIMPFARISATADGLARALGARRGQRVATVSFGVGGKESKRLGAGFEDSLLESLRNRGYCVVLDCGAGKAEADETAARFRAFAGSKLHRDERDAAEAELAELITWKGSLAGLGQLISCSDVYIGYDSAAAHLAAACAVPVVSVFAGAPSDRFRMRWTPFGPGQVRVIPAGRSSSSASVLVQVEAALAGIERASNVE